MVDLKKKPTINEALLESLTTELSATEGSRFNKELLKVKIDNAVLDVISVRKYPKYYTDKDIQADLKSLYPKIRKIALYDYNTIGMEFQSASTENSTGRTMIDRDELFIGILPLSVCY